MAKRRVSRQDIIDLIISRATYGWFTSDKLAGKAPPITFENFTYEAFRLGARALRAHLSRLPDTDLADEAEAALDLHEKRREWVSQNMARDRSERQAERGRKHACSLRSLQRRAIIEALGKAQSKHGTQLSRNRMRQRTVNLSRSKATARRKRSCMCGHWAERKKDRAAKSRNGKNATGAPPSRNFR
jgi:hypothetical protein